MGVRRSVRGAVGALLFTLAAVLVAPEIDASRSLTSGAANASNASAPSYLETRIGASEIEGRDLVGALGALSAEERSGYAASSGGAAADEHLRVLVHNAKAGLGTKVLRAVGTGLGLVDEGAEAASALSRTARAARGLGRRLRSASGSLRRLEGLSNVQRTQLAELAVKRRELLDWAGGARKAAFAQGKRAGGHFLRELGKRTEDLADEVLGIFPELRTVRSHVRFDPSTKSNYDRLLRSIDALGRLEVKSGLRYGSKAFGRTVEHATKLSRSRGGLKALWFLTEPTARDLAKFRQAIPPSAWRSVRRYHDVEGLAEFALELIRRAGK